MTNPIMNGLLNAKPAPAKKTVAIEMTWQNAVQHCILLLESGNAEGKATAREELMRCAKLADQFVKISKKGKM